MNDEWRASALTRRAHAFAPGARRSRCGWMRSGELLAPAHVLLAPRCQRCLRAVIRARQDELRVTGTAAKRSE